MNGSRDVLPTRVGPEDQEEGLGPRRDLIEEIKVD